MELDGVNVHTNKTWHDELTYLKVWFPYLNFWEYGYAKNTAYVKRRFLKRLEQMKRQYSEKG